MVLRGAGAIPGGDLGVRAAVQVGEGTGVELGAVQKAGLIGVVTGGTGAEAPRRDLCRPPHDQNLPPP